MAATDLLQLNIRDERNDKKYFEKVGQSFIEP